MISLIVREFLHGTVGQCGSERFHCSVSGNKFAPMCERVKKKVSH